MTASTTDQRLRAPSGTRRGRRPFRWPASRRMPLSGPRAEPRRFSSLGHRRRFRGVTAGTCDRSAGRGRGGGANDRAVRRGRRPGRRATRALAMVASIFERLRTIPASAISRATSPVGVAGDPADVEPVEGAAEIFPLAQDDPATTARSGTPQADALEQRRGVVQRTAPLGVVVVAVQDGVGRGQPWNLGAAMAHGQRTRPSSSDAAVTNRPGRRSASTARPRSGPRSSSRLVVRSAGSPRTAAG